MSLPLPSGPATSHDGRELELMLAGVKPAAMFCDRVPDGPGVAGAARAFAPHVAAGRVVEHRSDHRRPDGRVALHRVVYTLPGEGWRAAALRSLHERLYAGGGTWSPACDAEVSLLLGYAEEEARRYAEGRLRSSTRRWRRREGARPSVRGRGAGPSRPAVGFVACRPAAGGGAKPMAWSRGGRIRRPRAWASTGAYRELVRRLPRCAGSRRRLLALVERRGRGMGGLGATREEAAAFAGWRGPLAPD